MRSQKTAIYMFYLCRNETIAFFWTRILLEVLRFLDGCRSDDKRLDYYIAYYGYYDVTWNNYREYYYLKIVLEWVVGTGWSWLRIGKGGGRL